MQQRINPEIDIINYILDAVLAVKPDDAFCKSLRVQYAERGGLSKKQLEGLQGKAQRIEGIHPGRLATLEAIIKKKHVTHRSSVTVLPVISEKDEAAQEMIRAILSKYPGHKMLLLLKAKAEKDGKLSVTDKAELERLYKVLIKA